MSTTSTGGHAETLAAAELVRRRYRIVTRNYRVKAGEIDIIAEDGQVLCFVEVRARNRLGHGSPEETISRTKRRRIAAAASAYLMRYTREPLCRFDVVAVEPTAIRVTKDAFRLEDC